MMMDNVSMNKQQIHLTCELNYCTIINVIENEEYIFHNRLSNGIRKKMRSV